MSKFDLNLSLNVLYNNPVEFSFEAFAKNENMPFEDLKKISETDDTLVIGFSNTTTTFKKVNGKLDIDYSKFQVQADLFKNQDFAVIRHQAIDESKDHTFHVQVSIETNEESAFLEIQALFFATVYLTDMHTPVGVYMPENEVLLCYEDFDMFAVGQINDWGMYVAWFNVFGEEKKGKTTIYTKGIKKLGEKDLEIKVKNKGMDIASKFVFNLVMNCLSTTSSYHDGETCTNILNGKDYEFEKEKSKYLNHKVLRLIKD